MKTNPQKAQVTLTHLSLRSAAKLLGVSVYQVQMLLADGVLKRVTVIDPVGGSRSQVSADSVQVERSRREAAKKKSRAA